MSTRGYVKLEGLMSAVWVLTKGEAHEVAQEVTKRMVEDDAQDLAEWGMKHGEEFGEVVGEDEIAEIDYRIEVHSISVFERNGHGDRKLMHFMTVERGSLLIYDGAVEGIDLSWSGDDFVAHGVRMKLLEAAQALEYMAENDEGSEALYERIMEWMAKTGPHEAVGLNGVRSRYVGSGTIRWRE